MVESKALDELTKMDPLLEILEGPTDSISRAEVQVHSGRLNKDTPEFLKIALVNPIR